MRGLHDKAVSTALATIAIILVLILGMSWMAYMTVINAAQQARHAAAAETAALKAKELVRVYIWLDPARQSDGSYQNLTRISFVNTWSGETTINSLLIVWRDGRYEERPVSIRLGAGEDRTFLPSQLGLEGLDNYQAALERIKYIQVHTSLGNDFVSLWGRPDKPALYVTGTTRTDTYTVTRTSTTATATTTTRTTTTTSYTTTRTTTITWPPPPGTPRLQWRLRENYCTYISVLFSFDPNGWGTPPYQIRGQWSAYNRWRFQLASGSFGPYTTSGGYSWTVGMSAYPDPASYSWTVTVIDSEGRVAEWRQGTGVNCDYNPPTTSQGPTTGPPGPTTTPPGTTLPPAATTYTITETQTVTSFLYSGAWTTVTQTAYATRVTTVTHIDEDIYYSYAFYSVTLYWVCGGNGPFDEAQASQCTPQKAVDILQKYTTMPAPWNSLALIMLAALVSAPQPKVRKHHSYIIVSLLLLTLATGLFHGAPAAKGFSPATAVYTTTITTTITVTSTISTSGTVTVTTTSIVTQTVTTTAYRYTSTIISSVTLGTTCYCMHAGCANVHGCALICEINPA